MIFPANHPGGFSVIQVPRYPGFTVICFRKYGDAKHLRKLYTRALTSTQDYPEAIAREWLDFELQDGSLESLEVATDRVDKRLKEVRRR